MSLEIREWGSEEIEWPSQNSEVEIEMSDDITPDL